jgi:DNA replication protein DnaC
MLQTKISGWLAKTNGVVYTPEELWAMREKEIELHQKKMNAEKSNISLDDIPLRFRDKIFSDYRIDHVDQKRVKNLAERFVKTFSERKLEGTPLKFVGKSGTGKTLLAFIIYQELVKAGYSVRYESSMEFIKDLLEIKFNSQSHYRSHFEKLCQYDLLIIDETTESINKDGAPSEVEKQLFLRLINERYANRLCTLIITNRDNDELVNRLGSPIVRRLSENGISLAFTWDAYQQKQG